MYVFLRLHNQNNNFIIHFSLYKRILNETYYAYKVDDNLLQNVKYITQTVPL